MNVPFVNNSDTSAAAAVSMRKSAAIIREMIRKHIVDAGPLGSTCDEAEVALDLRHQTASARFTELSGDVLIRDSGERRQTRSGRNAVVWVAI